MVCGDDIESGVHGLIRLCRVISVIHSSTKTMNMEVEYENSTKIN